MTIARMATPVLDRSIDFHACVMSRTRITNPTTAPAPDGERDCRGAGRVDDWMRYRATQAAYRGEAR
jgi:hypothetical protein